MFIFTFSHVAYLTLLSIKSQDCSPLFLSHTSAFVLLPQAITNNYLTAKSKFIPRANGNSSVHFMREIRRFLSNYVKNNLNFEIFKSRV